MGTIETLFKDREYCYSQLREARALFGSTKTTEGQWDAMTRALGLGYLYCPEDLRWLFEGTMREATQREWHFMTKVWPMQEMQKKLEHE